LGFALPTATGGRALLGSSIHRLNCATISKAGRGTVVRGVDFLRPNAKAAKEHRKPNGLSPSTAPSASPCAIAVSSDCARDSRRRW
jgi:hypothetical protein